jgi:hypothetical protein
MSGLEGVEGWRTFTEAQRARLREIASHAARVGWPPPGFDLIAWEGRLPVVYAFECQEAYVLHADGKLIESPEPASDGLDADVDELARITGEQR